MSESGRRTPQRSQATAPGEESTHRLLTLKLFLIFSRKMSTSHLDLDAVKEPGLYYSEEDV